MRRSLIWAGVLLGLSGIVTSDGEVPLTLASAEQGIGLQLDLVGRGLAYSWFSETGFGIELAAHAKGQMQDSLTYRVGAELRLLKRLNSDKPLRVCIGVATGIWQMKDWFHTGYYDYDSSFVKVLTGVSVAGLVGLEWRFLKLEDGGALSVMPEFQLGLYTLPERSDVYPLSWDNYTGQTITSFLPGAGIGIRYVW